VESIIDRGFQDERNRAERQRAEALAAKQKAEEEAEKEPPPQVARRWSGSWNRREQDLRHDRYSEAKGGNMRCSSSLSDFERLIQIMSCACKVRAEREQERLINQAG
jgi:hypothetical protein